MSLDFITKPARHVHVIRRAEGHAVDAGPGDVAVATAAGRAVIVARGVIDAAGNGSVAVRCGTFAPKTPSGHVQAEAVMFRLAGLNKAQFMAEVKADAQTCKDWVTGEWTVETVREADATFSPFLKEPLGQAIKARAISTHLSTIADTCGAMRDKGELTCVNLVHPAGIDGADPDSLTRGEIEGCKQAMLAIEALRQFIPACSGGHIQ